MDSGSKSLEILDPRERTRERRLQERPVSAPVFASLRRTLVASRQPAGHTRHAVSDHSRFHGPMPSGHEHVEGAFPVACCRQDLER